MTPKTPTDHTVMVKAKFPQALHYRLKMEAVRRRQTIVSLIEEFVLQGLRGKKSEKENEVNHD